MTDTHSKNDELPASSVGDFSDEQLQTVVARLDEEGREKLAGEVRELTNARDSAIARERSDILAKMEETIGVAEHAVSAEERSMTMREEEQERGEMLPHIESSIRRS